jgi:hypothetical protein
MKIDPEKVKIKEVIEEVNRHSRMMARQEELNNSWGMYSIRIRHHRHWESQGVLGQHFELEFMEQVHGIAFLCYRAEDEFSYSGDRVVITQEGIRRIYQELSASWVTNLVYNLVLSTCIAFFVSLETTGWDFLLELRPTIAQWQRELALLANGSSLASHLWCRPRNMLNRSSVPI